MTITLDSLLPAFLKSQGLKDCSITFEPHCAIVARRSKRSNSTLDTSSDPKNTNLLGELRGRANTRQKEMLQKVERTLIKALCCRDRHADGSKTNKIPKTLLAERREETA